MITLEAVLTDASTLAIICTCFTVAGAGDTAGNAKNGADTAAVGINAKHGTKTAVLSTKYAKNEVGTVAVV